MTAPAPPSHKHPAWDLRPTDLPRASILAAERRFAEIEHNVVFRAMHWRRRRKGPPLGSFLGALLTGSAFMYIPLVAIALPAAAFWPLIPFAIGLWSVASRQTEKSLHGPLQVLGQITGLPSDMLLDLLRSPLPCRDFALGILAYSLARSHSRFVRTAIALFIAAILGLLLLPEFSGKPIGRWMMLPLLYFLVYLFVGMVHLEVLTIQIASGFLNRAYIDWNLEWEWTHRPKYGKGCAPAFFCLLTVIGLEIYQLRFDGPPVPLALMEGLLAIIASSSLSTPAFNVSRAEIGRGIEAYAKGMGILISQIRERLVDQPTPTR